MATIASLILSTGITSAFLQVFVEKLANLTLKKISQYRDIDDNLQKLERTLFKIQSLVDDVENKQGISNACHILIEDFKFVLFDSDDLLDTIGLGIEKLNSGTQTNRQSDNDLATLSAAIRFKVGKMLEKVVVLVGEMEGYFMSEITKPRPPQILAPQSGSLVDESNIIGRKNDKEEIVNMLLTWPTTEDVRAVAIEGMAGIGKTTLAQLAYNDAGVAKNFALRMWVCVSFQDDALAITKSIYESATKKVWELSGLDSIQIELQGRMRGEKVLLVLDGMCDKHMSTWDAIKLPFRFAELGSMIVVTTRSKVVSSIVTAGRAYCVPTLDDKLCWKIIKQCLGRNVGEHEDLEKIGLKIAGKCKGLPLAAKVIGSVLRAKSKEMEWDDLLKCELWDFPEFKNQIYPVLKLSYDHLPAHLKRCFAYCSIFRHSYPCRKDDLIQLWAAEGFIQPQGTRRVEDIGREYFDDLCSRFFFRVSSNVLDEQIYKMHDFIQDLGRLVSTNLCFRVEDSSSRFLSISRNVRHLSLLDHNIQPSTLKEFYRYEKMRTFMLLSKNTSLLDKVPCEFFIKLHCLRVLNLSCSRISSLDGPVENLKHLRYLNLSNTPIQKLPNSVTKIYGLETLKLNNCCQLLELPKDLKDLVKLRHLDFDRHRQMISMPIGIGKLISLETLNVFIVGRREGYGIEQLESLSCLRGSICIKNLENVANLVEAKKALNDKQYLEKLELQWIRSRDATLEKEVLMCLKPHDRLKELRIRGYSGANFPNWIGNRLRKLEGISIDSCPQLVTLPSIHRLTSLKNLSINGCPQLRSLPDEGLPSSLKRLIISESDMLKERCKGPDGDDWNKIKSIPEVVIDDEEIQTQGQQN